MIVIERSAASTLVGDLLLDDQLAQFAEIRNELLKFNPGMIPADFPEDARREFLERAKYFSNVACDTSRGIMFRLQRAYPSQLQSLIEEFDSAAAVIEHWDLSACEPEDRKLIRNFGLHVHNRAVRLNGQLPFGQQVVLQSKFE